MTLLLLASLIYQMKNYYKLLPHLMRIPLINRINEFTESALRSLELIS